MRRMPLSYVLCGLQEDTGGKSSRCYFLLPRKPGVTDLIALDGSIYMFFFFKNTSHRVSYKDIVILHIVQSNKGIPNRVTCA